VVKIVKAKAGLLKLVAKGLPFAVPTGNASIDVVLSLDGGTNTYCMTFSGFGNGSTFLVKDAAPGNCRVCGDNDEDVGEQCDGTDDAACPGSCLGDCTCPVCGDNNAEGLEACDGADDAACPGLCDTDCTCTPPCESTVGGFCWFRGAGGDSCDTTCANNGRIYDAATSTYAGSAGTTAHCALLANDFGSVGATTLACSNGVGCADTGLVPFLRCTSPTTTAAAATPSFRRICACQNAVPTACGDTAPTCGGACPAGDTCVNIFGVACGCVGDPCGSAPTCGGSCPVGYVCTPDSVDCFCVDFSGGS
jgi:hypothetical protein